MKQLIVPSWLIEHISGAGAILLRKALTCLKLKIMKIDRRDRRQSMQKKKAFDWIDRRRAEQEMQEINRKLR